MPRAAPPPEEPACFPFPTHHFSGSDSDRQSVGHPGHCEACAEHGHVVAHPALGCGDVGCTQAHDLPTELFSAVGSAILPEHVHAEVTVRQEPTPATTGVIVWADRHYSVCPRCGQDIPTEVDRPASLGQHG